MVNNIKSHNECWTESWYTLTAVAHNWIISVLLLLFSVHRTSVESVVIVINRSVKLRDSHKNASCKFFATGWVSLSCCRDDTLRALWHSFSTSIITCIVYVGNWVIIENKLKKSFARSQRWVHFRCRVATIHHHRDRHQTHFPKKIL